MMMLLLMMIMMFRRMMIMIIVILTDSSSGTYSEALWCYERCLAIKILAAGLKIIDTSIFYSFISLHISTYLSIISYHLISSYHLICSGETHQCLTSTYNSLGLIHKLHGERDDVLSVAVCRKSYLRCDCCCETTNGWMY